MEKLGSYFKLGFRMRDEVKHDATEMFHGRTVPLKSAIGGAGLGSIAGGAIGAIGGHAGIGGLVGAAAGAYGGHKLRQKQATIEKTANNPKVIAMNILGKAKKVLPKVPNLLDSAKRLANRGLTMSSASPLELTGKLGKFAAIRAQKL